jgi:VWFA-related protein
MLFGGLGWGQTNGAATAPAEPKESSEPVLFRSGVSNVRIDAQVIREGQIVADLTKDDFVVLDGGARKELVYFGRDAEPVTLLLLLDVSGSMKKYVEQIASVSRQALSVLKPGDRVGIMVFARESKIRLPFTDNFETVVRDLREAVAEESVGSSTSINEALLAAANHMEREAGERGRRAILILTDNLGLNYKSPDQPVIEALWSADTVLNGLVVGKASRPEIREGRYTNPDFTPPDVFRISEETGGESVQATKASLVFPQMVERIRTRYSLHYRTPEGAQGFRKVQVELSPAAKLRLGNAQVRARKGYRAGS